MRKGWTWGSGERDIQQLKSLEDCVILAFSWSTLLTNSMPPAVWFDFGKLTLQKPQPMPNKIGFLSGNITRHLFLNSLLAWSSVVAACKHANNYSRTTHPLKQLHIWHNTSVGIVNRMSGCWEKWILNMSLVALSALECTVACSSTIVASDQERSVPSMSFVVTVNNGTFQIHCTVWT